MKIRLRLFATLQGYLPPDSSEGETLLELPDDTAIPDVLETLGVPLNLAHILFVNGRHVLRPNLASHRLQDGDILAVFPAIGGG